MKKVATQIPKLLDYEMSRLRVILLKGNLITRIIGKLQTTPRLLKLFFFLLPFLSNMLVGIQMLLLKKGPKIFATIVIHR